MFVCVVCAVWSMVCLYILYYECVLITSVRNEHICVQSFRLLIAIVMTDRTFKTGLMLSANNYVKCQNDCMI